MTKCGNFFRPKKQKAGKTLFLFCSLPSVKKRMFRQAAETNAQAAGALAEKAWRDATAKPHNR
jgi:hypothetical protein